MIKSSYDTIDESDRRLVTFALDTRQRAYAPYSNFKVGAALLDESGTVHTGCNIESADYTLTSHAEMVAVDSMVKSGVTRPKTLAVALKEGNGLPVPCGLCRQKLAEFADEDLKIICVGLDDNDNIVNIYIFTLEELLPHSFSSKNFEN